MSKIQQQKRKNKIRNNPLQQGVWDYATSAPYVYILLFIVILLIYGKTLSFFLGKLDEPDIILANIPFLRDFGNLKDALMRDAFFSMKSGAFYRPVQNLSFMIDAHLSGVNGWGYYLSNLFIHWITCSSIFYLLMQLGSEKRAALGSTLFFAVSPLFVQALAWAPSRGDLLIGMFSVLSLIFLIKYIRTSDKKSLIYHLLFLGLAIFTKETAILLPLLFFFYYFFMEKERKIPLTGLLILPLCYLFLIASYLFLRSKVVTTSVPGQIFGITPLLYNFQTLPEFISKFFIPVYLSPMPAFGLGPTILGLLLAAVLIFVSFKYLSGTFRWFIFGSGWFLLFTIPGMMYRHIQGEAAYDYLEHRAYLPLIGVVILLAFLITESKIEKKIRQFFIFMLVICACFAIYAHLYTRHYSNPVAFYNRAIETNPQSAVALYNRGEIFVFQDKDYQRAIVDFNAALKIKPDYAKAIVNRGICKEMAGDTLAALKDCEEGARMDSTLFIAHKNIAIIKGQLGLKAEAINAWDRALKISPDYYQGYTERGILEFQAEHYLSAEKDFSESIGINNQYAPAYLNRGLIFYMKKESKKACDDWKLAAGLGSEPAQNLLREYCNN
ncbi:MAG: glycosyltransferase family 39 protein [Bacteroidota bacterium]